MFESIGNLVTLSNSNRQSTPEKSYCPSPISTHTTTSNAPASPTRPRTSKRHPSYPINTSPPSVSSHSYSASRTSSISDSSSPSQAQGMLSKVASSSPSASRLTTPVMTPTEESAPYTNQAFGMSTPASNGVWPGLERSQHGYISFPDFEQFRQSLEACNMQNTGVNQQEKS